MKTNKDGTKTWAVTLGTSDPNGYVAVLDMIPRTLDIRPGDTVRVGDEQLIFEK